VAHSPRIEGVLTCEQPRRDCLEELPKPHYTVNELDAAFYSYLQAHVLPKILHFISGGKITLEKAVAEAEKILGTTKTFSEIHKAISDFADHLRTDSTS